MYNESNWIINLIKMCALRLSQLSIIGKMYLYCD